MITVPQKNACNQLCDYLDVRHKENESIIDKLRFTLHGLEVYSLDSMLDQIKIALNPKYYPLTNKEVLQNVFETEGANLFHGLDKLKKDMHKNNLPKLSCIDHFKLGKNIATTKGNVIFENHLMEVIHYKAIGKRVYKDPLLIIPPWINKYYIFDLNKEKSFVQYCLNQGIDTYIISWKNAKKQDRKIGFKDYVVDGIEKCLEIIQKPTHVLGFCLGGVGTLISSVINKNIKSTTLLATPIDFSKLKELKKTIDYMNVEEAFKRVQKNGFQSGKNILKMFCMLKPEQTLMTSFVEQYYLNKSPEPNDFMFWNMDSINLPAKMHNEYIEDFFIKNKMHNNSYFLGKRKINLNKMNKPIFVLATEKDHIVPRDSAFALKSPLAKYVLGGSGHVAGVINPPKSKKYGYSVLDSEGTVLEQKSGSWWIEWLNWITPQLGNLEMVVSDKNIIRKAPGKYVLDQEDLNSYR